MAIDAVKRFGDVVRETPELKNNPALAPLRTKLLKEPQAFFKRLRDRLQADRGDDARFARPPGGGEFRPGRAHRTRSATSRTPCEPTRNRWRSGSGWRARTRRSPSSRATWPGATPASAACRARSGRPAEAMASLERALAIRERLARENPSVTEFQSDLAGSYNNIGIAAE